MSTLEELDEVVMIFKNANCDFEIMHCNGSYPMPENEANLMCIQTLKKRYGCNVGYSGHESTLLKICITAVALGATSIERHITLDRAMYGSDQAASLEIGGLYRLVEYTREIEKALGNGEKSVTEKEKAIAKKLRKIETI